MLPVAAVAVRLPPTLDVAKSMPEALARLASPLAPVVFSATVPVMSCVSSVMVALLPEVV